ncbi:hypothetical protein [Streptomyces sp. NPDC127105]|uniref:hypothetical protein n=1 Tax=Streptomyces sp. NPDC127105 TaxID=3345359 RepID=UPI003652A05B
MTLRTRILPVLTALLFTSAPTAPTALARAASPTPTGAPDSTTASWDQRVDG